jgi:thiol-disulfide isomerase/thioredoxin
MILRFTVACALLIGATGSLYSQNIQKTVLLPKKWKEISLGETIPDIAISGFFDDSTKQVRLSDLYKNKLLILDFWATTCGGCIKEMPHLKELKRQYSDRLEFLLVNYESRGKVAAFEQRFKILGDGTLRSLVADRILHEWFPHQTVPHFVWISEKGKVIGITDQISLTNDNIAKAMNDEVAMRVKKDNLTFQPSQSFHLRDSTYSVRSIITGRTNGINSYGQVFQVPEISRIFMSNMSLFQMYASAAFGNTQFETIKYKMLVETKDSLEFFAPWMAKESFKHSKYKDEDEWAEENTYCYDLDFKKPMPQEQMRKYMIEDLNRYFNLNGRFEKRKLSCWVLKANRKAKKLAALKGERSGVYGDVNGGLKVQNEPMDVFAESLGKRARFPRIINQTKINFAVTINLPGPDEVVDLKVLNEQLKPLGLYLKEAKHYIDVFVVSKNH